MIERSEARTLFRIGLFLTMLCCSYNAFDLYIDPPVYKEHKLIVNTHYIQRIKTNPVDYIYEGWVTYEYNNGQNLNITCELKYPIYKHHQFNMVQYFLNQNSPINQSISGYVKNNDIHNCLLKLPDNQQDFMSLIFMACLCAMVQCGFICGAYDDTPKERSFYTYGQILNN